MTLLPGQHRRQCVHHFVFVFGAKTVFEILQDCADGVRLFDEELGDLSRLSDQGRMVAMSGGSRPNKFCKCAIVDLYVLHSIHCDVRHFDKGVLTLLG